MLRCFVGLLAAALFALSPIAAQATALSITAANVSLVSGPHDSDQIAGEAFIAGAVVYQKSTDFKWYKAQSDGTAEEAGSVDLGIALATADAAGARITIAKTGAIVALGTSTAGTFYAISRTAGSIIPVADLASTDKATMVGLGIGTNQMLINRLYSSTSVTP